MRAVRDRDAVGGAQTTEAPALHRASKALALGTPRDIDHLARDEMIRGEFGAHIEQAVFFHAEFAEDRLGLDLGLAEMAALRLGDVLGLGAAGAEDRKSTRLNSSH